VEVAATNEEALLRHVLSLGDRAEILAPKPLREKARKVLTALARRVA
jgi:proteasome accessory factor B